MGKWSPLRRHFGREQMKKLNRKLLVEMEQYIQRNLAQLEIVVIEEELKEADYSLHESLYQMEIEEFIKSNRKPTLSQTLFRFIDKRGVSDSEVYKKAGIDRRHFSKIRSNPDYRPGKNTIIALALALELSKKETDQLLGSAGYSLSESDTSDLVIQFCLEKNIYNIHEVNEALDYFSLKPLTGV